MGAAAHGSVKAEAPETMPGFELWLWVDSCVT